MFVCMFNDSRASLATGLLHDVDGGGGGGGGRQTVCSVVMDLLMLVEPVLKHPAPGSFLFCISPSFFVFLSMLFFFCICPYYLFIFSILVAFSYSFLHTYSSLLSLSSSRSRQFSFTCCPILNSVKPPPSLFSLSLNAISAFPVLFRDCTVEKII